MYKNVMNFKVYNHILPTLPQPTIMISRPYIFDYLSVMEISESGFVNIKCAISVGANISKETLKKLKQNSNNQITVQDGM